jgi:tRNA pseudouridine32 synthase/23S rRNA pseudouridine746 synthase
VFIPIGATTTVMTAPTTPAWQMPLLDGVGASCVVLPAFGWPTVAAFLSARFAAVTAQAWLQRMQDGKVLDASGAALAPDAPFRAHARIFYYRSLDHEPRIPFEEEILFQDDLLIAVDKPHFLPVTPGGAYLQETLLVRLRRRLGIETLTPMHRLDRDTAGIVLFGVVPAHRNRYQALFRDRQIAKDYEAVAPWLPHLCLPLERASRMVESPAFMQMCEVAGSANAHTRISLLERDGVRARYLLQPTTGQKHQLRLHMAALGLPIVNDRIYPLLLPAPLPGSAPDYSAPLQLLARRLAFNDPVSGAPREFISRRQLLL